MLYCVIMLFKDWMGVQGRGHSNTLILNIMIIYSKTIITFMKQAKKMAMQILSDEMNCQVSGQRFRYKRYYYPLTIVCFEGQSQLGYFKPHGYEIGLNKKLFYQSKDSVIKDILRHELAHYFTYLNYGPGVAVHGKEFREICHTFGWGKEVFLEKLNLEMANQRREGEIEKEKIIIKIQKLLALSSSSNINESQLATQKANELLIKYNIERLSENCDEEVYVKRILKKGRTNGKLRAIYEILKTFFVSPVFNYGKEGVYLEVVGKKVNVEMAEFVGLYLDRELESLWETIKIQEGIKGVRSKNSFMEGVAKGYIDKINEAQASETKALIIVAKNLKEDLKMVYPRLSSSSSQSKIDPRSKNLGQGQGKKLKFGRPLEKGASLIKGFLT